VSYFTTADYLVSMSGQQGSAAGQNNPVDRVSAYAPILMETGLSLPGRRL
jgi:hypothetical protein